MDALGGFQDSTSFHARQTRCSLAQALCVNFMHELCQAYLSMWVESAAGHRRRDRGLRCGSALLKGLLSTPSRYTLQV